MDTATRTKLFTLAAKEVRKCGWWQKASVGPDGQVCAGQALQRASLSVSDNNVGKSVDLYHEAREITDRELGSGLVYWNDCVATSDAQVIGFFERLSD